MPALMFCDMLSEGFGGSDNLLKLSLCIPQFRDITAEMSALYRPSRFDYKGSTAIAKPSIEDDPCVAISFWIQDEDHKQSGF